MENHAFIQLNVHSRTIAPTFHRNHETPIHLEVRLLAFISIISIIIIGMKWNTNNERSNNFILYKLVYCNHLLIRLINQIVIDYLLSVVYWRV